jgi:hypothetical protein
MHEELNTTGTASESRSRHSIEEGPRKAAPNSISVDSPISSGCQIALPRRNGLGGPEAEKWVFSAVEQPGWLWSNHKGNCQPFVLMSLPAEAALALEASRCRFSPGDKTQHRCRIRCSKIREPPSDPLSKA